MQKILLMLSMILGLSVVTIEAKELPVSRIVVMDFGALDTLDELGARDLIVALPKNNLPEYLEQYNKDSIVSSGGMKAPDIDKIQATNPDLIVISGRQNTFYEALTQTAPTIRYIVDVDHYLSSVKNHIFALAKSIEKEEIAREKWDNLERKINEIKDALSKQTSKAIVLIHNEGKLIAAPSNYAHFIHTVLGVPRADTNISKERFVVDVAYLSKIDADVIYIVDRSAAIGATPLGHEIFKQNEYQKLKAITSNKVVLLTPKLWYLSGNGLQSIALQADEIARSMK